MMYNAWCFCRLSTTDYLLKISTKDKQHLLRGSLPYSHWMHLLSIKAACGYRANPAMLATAPHLYVPIYTTATLQKTILGLKASDHPPTSHTGRCSSFKSPQEWADAAVKPGITECCRRALCISCFNRLLFMYQKMGGRETDGETRVRYRERV